jgi:hypothetical protein
VITHRMSTSGLSGPFVAALTFVFVLSNDTAAGPFHRRGGCDSRHYAACCSVVYCQECTPAETLHYDECIVYRYDPLRSTFVYDNSYDNCTEANARVSYLRWRGIVAGFECHAAKK